MEWSPQDAMKAYLQTLHLCKVQNNEERKTKVIEPRCIEFLSALAAGKRARLIVQVSAEGITPLTIALAVAAKQTGGQLVCILPQREQVEKSRAWVIGNDLEDVIELDYGNPCEVIDKYMSIDFAVIDCKFEDHLSLSKMMKLNPTGAVVVVANNLKAMRDRVPFVEVLEGEHRLESVTLPIGEGMELIRFGSVCKRQTRRYKRFHVTFEN
ncbi:uncharacterized protein LOC107423426 [Ziziphus jujuba]|uniref:Uncharacterized protein LOC107423426 n=2 Tax=Ziziphus jujuba TaxID=326968 RepID=A0AC41Z5I9_ZIZJJ|nr:uncharacterized protein LOC107423426 [Ziziphus jujuba]